MKIKINGEYVNVSFWSILKAHLIASIVFGALFYAIIILLANIYYAI